jgi:hypothetical protein
LQDDHPDAIGHTLAGWIAGIEAATARAGLPGGMMRHKAKPAGHTARAKGEYRGSFAKRWPCSQVRGQRALTGAI